MEKTPNWLRYVVALPAGVIVVIAFGLLLYLSNMIFSEPNSFYNILTTFIYKNGVNIIIFLGAINFILPKHQFIITLILSITLGIFYSIVFGITIIQNQLSLESTLAFIEIIASLIISCWLSFAGKFTETK